MAAAEATEPTERWTAKRRVALVVSILKGETSVAEAGLASVDGREMGPAVLAPGNMRHIHRPPFITPTRPAHP